MQEIIKNLETARAAILVKCDAALLSYEVKSLEVKKILDEIASYKHDLSQIDSAISVLQESQNTSERPVVSTAKEFNALAEFMDSVIIWECSYVAGCRLSDIARVCAYRFSSYDDSLSFVKDRAAVLCERGALKPYKQVYTSVRPGKIAPPFSVAVSVSGIRHGYVKLPPMVEPNEASLRALTEQQTWYNKHKYNTRSWVCSYDPSSKIFSMKRKAVSL